MSYEDEPPNPFPDEQSPEESEEAKKDARRKANEAAMRARRDERFGRSLRWDL